MIYAMFLSKRKLLPKNLISTIPLHKRKLKIAEKFLSYKSACKDICQWHINNLMIINF